MSSSGESILICFDMKRKKRTLIFFERYHQQNCPTLFSGVYTGPASTCGKREKTGWLKTEREAAIPASPRVKKEFNAALLRRAQANSFHSCFN